MPPATFSPELRSEPLEHTENDDFWGHGGDGTRRNELGRILDGGPRAPAARE